MIDRENIENQLRRGILELAVLLIVSERAVYAAEILDKLQKAGLITVEGTIYPMLSRLKRDGIVEYTWQESENGPPRKYYSLTDLGMEYLKTYRTIWEGMVSAVNELI